MTAVVADARTARPHRLLAPPFFEIGPKNLLRLPATIDLAIAAGEAGVRHGVSVILTVPTAHISAVRAAAPDVFVFAQEMQADPLGPSVGRTLAEMLADAEAHGVMLNHDSNPTAPGTLPLLIERAQENGLMTMVCAGSDAEVRDLLPLSPTVVLYEPPELIGGDGGGDRPWIEAVTRDAGLSAPDVLMMHAGGVAHPRDAEQIMRAGAHGTGVTSAVVRSESPRQAAADFIASTRAGFDAARS
ncbi:triose-phosphate isomerase [Microbacterium sp. 1.5R]|uniref:triose-phosphate isomerase n=1 Tax=Microbacterium sp. 1.5R TaxID=1916917 RepID=UPI0011AA95C3|nr:triose-phosphate isomerase [Microbacterium sp. 1.5R]